MTSAFATLGIPPLQPASPAKRVSYQRSGLRRLTRTASVDWKPFHLVRVLLTGEKITVSLLRCVVRSERAVSALLLL